MNQQRGHNHNPLDGLAYRTCMPKHIINYIGHGIPLHFSTRHGRIGHACPCEEQFKIVVNFGTRTYCGAGVAS